MEKRVFTTDSDTVQDNSTGDMQQAWTSDKTSPVPADKKYKEAVDAFGQMIYADLVRERDELREENQEDKERIALLVKENTELRELTTDQALELQRFKKTLAKLQQQLSAQNDEELVVSTDLHNFEFDVVHFDEYITIEQINSLFLNLQKLVQVKISPDQYLIDSAAAVIPIYIILTQSKKINPIYRYKGGMKDFCIEWNSNVASRITDNERAQTLTCNYEAFRKEHGRAPWRDSSPAKWTRDYSDTRNKKKMERAINTKMRLEMLLA